MAIDFMVINKGKVNYRKCFMSICFEEEIHTFLMGSAYASSLGGSFLLGLDDYDDTLISESDIAVLLEFCGELLRDFQMIYDYTLFDRLKADGIKQQNIVDFAKDFQALLLYAQENDKAVYAVGD